MSARVRSGDRDPFARFVALAADRPEEGAFYFERGESPGRAGREAFFGLGPKDRIVWSEPRDVEEHLERARRVDRSSRGGCWAGYAGFDAVGLFEPLLYASTPSGSPFPSAVFDRYPHVERAPVHGHGPRADLWGLPPGPWVGSVHDACTPAAFGRSVDRLKEAIYDGEAFQVVLAHRRSRSLRGSLLPVVERLRRAERFAYLFYYRFEDALEGSGGPLEIVGASPESVVEVRGRTVSINPIAGTRPFPAPSRGPRARLPLDKDPKELAEHRMLVDLARNDLGRIARVGSVRLSRREVRVPYARLEHLVSRVVAELPSGTGALDALLSAFPAGTVSGAPKIRATELLRHEERTWRGPYGGAVGLMMDRGEAEFALGIRSAFAARGKVHTEAGAGIVHLSEAEREWDETLVKLDATERALTGRPVGRRAGSR